MGEIEEYYYIILYDDTMIRIRNAQENVIHDIKERFDRD